ncbi:hypothetical protein [Pseudomonas saponiphila]|uniref:hypothetical protein n=1 Tax=Pseudomonas saponiphila TaxID=556534 RepID=UPI00223EE9B5|nr:hypothetical protein [Pseudomonas saponiphila]
MLKRLSASEINQIVRIFRSAITNRGNPAAVLNEVMAIHKLNTDLIVESKSVDHGLVTALLMILESPDLYGLDGEKLPLITPIIEKICTGRPILSSRDKGRRLEVDLGL